ncbi:hypothetical protein QYE76_065110 [Lolium multiflorum]|uniref:GRF-type domain-containing protein n=1 Tax=Lolium multiflorum TaxID=4521 RepID=A0AAD8S8M3_LOLMU|nr:hypothetical protein QYE76_065110 [Lolium multiflorum]
MAYDGEKLCHCNPRKKAPRWISWSALNPGRRYYACPDAMNGNGCGYVEWHDAPLPKFWSDLIGDLRDVVWRMRAEQVACPRTEEDEGRDAKIQALEEELKEKKAEIGILKAKYDNLVMIFLVFVVGLVAGKLCFQ